MKNNCALLIEGFLIGFILLLLFSCNEQSKEIAIDSPTGKIKVRIIYEKGKLFYAVYAIESDSSISVILKSPLGLERIDGEFFKNLRIDSLSRIVTIKDSYNMITGKRRSLSYEANEAVIFLSNSENQKINIVFRVFDEGVAFKYVFPTPSGLECIVISEKTGFHIMKDSEGWMSPYEPTNNFGQPGYEKDYFHVKSGDFSPDSIGWAFPLLFKSGRYWLLISESDLKENYCGSHVYNEPGKNIYKIAFPEANERYGKGDVYPSSTLPWEMPWRFIVVSDSISNIYESNLVYHLAEPCKISNTSWIKPGRSSWEWWSSTGGRKEENLKNFIDLASEMGWEYSLIDGGWNKMSEGSIERLVHYARLKNVELNLWYNSGGRRDSTLSDKDFIVFNQDTRDNEFRRISELGFKGIKVDFFASDKQNVIKLYIDILRDAAKYNLLVNFHGCTLPRGWCRTYPNLMTMEAIRGAECYRYSESYPEKAASYNTLAAMVRGTIGPTDYTPVTISFNKYRRLTTISHELALALVYESGLIHFADKPDGYRQLPEVARNFLKIIPSVWDDTRLIAWKPSELFVVARKNNNKWFIAGINGKNTKQEVTVDLSEKDNCAYIITDSEMNEKLMIYELNKDLSNITITMQPYGGFVIY